MGEANLTVERPPGCIIFLHGASSSGKSTLGRAIQMKADRPFWRLSIDVLRDHGVLPMDRFRSGEFVWRDLRPAFFDGFHASLVAYARAGNDLIVEHILEHPSWLATLATMLRGIDVYFVGVHCPPDELSRREALRGDRPAGSAVADFERIHVGIRYDLEVDTTRPADENARIVLEAWRERSRPSAFEQVASAKP
jgi:chloramphenicol 3-O phosphotransferase